VQIISQSTNSLSTNAITTQASLRKHQRKQRHKHQRNHGASKMSCFAIFSLVVMLLLFSPSEQFSLCTGAKNNNSASTFSRLSAVPSTTSDDFTAFTSIIQAAQQTIIDRIEAVETASFSDDPWSTSVANGRTRVIKKGRLISKGAVSVR